MFGFFRSKGNLSGTLTVDGLPECKTFSVTLSLVSTQGEDDTAPAEFSSHALDNAISVAVKEEFDNRGLPLDFDAECSVGNYFIDVGVIDYREEEGKIYAQVEHFVPTQTPVIIEKNHRCDLAIEVTWPDIPLSDLGSYGIIKPGGDGKIHSD